MLVGITGGIGSGKTTICQQLERMGYPVYYSDQEAKRIIEEDKQVRHSIIMLLGEDAYCQGKYQTKYVAKRVFEHKEKLAQLNAIVHPAVLKDLAIWTGNKELCFVESAILLESGLGQLCDITVAILADKSLRLQRTLQRDYADRDGDAKKVEMRMQSQLTEEELQKQCTYFVWNDGSCSIISLAQELIDHIKKGCFI